MEFTDGSCKKLTPSRIRILSQYGGRLANEDLEESNVLREEQLVIQVDGISLRVEGYLGGILTPLLKLDSKITANVMNWSGQMSVDASITVHASYYNENVAEWEPVIEPIVEKNRERPWQLNVGVCYVLFSSNFSLWAFEGIYSNKKLVFLPFF